jgi:hypothetical protein
MILKYYNLKKNECQMSDKEDSYFQKEMKRKTSESKDRSNENMKCQR